jgi:hypothetical protein
LKNLDYILARKMSRKEFLLTIGAGIASVAGISTVLNILSGHHTSGRPVVQMATPGFGYGLYGVDGSPESLTKVRKINVL